MASQAEVTLDQFQWTDISPPIAFPHTHRGNEDPAAFIRLRKPKLENRPWLATPNGTAFVWPMGIEGFDVSHDATLGVHQYIGVNDVDAIVVYPDQTQIILNGVFPGATGVDAMFELKKVLREPTPKDGKYLKLPGVLADLARVQVQSARFSHESGDNTESVAYSITFIRVAIVQDGSESSAQVLDVQQQVSVTAAFKGTGTNTVTTGTKPNPLRSIAVGSIDQSLYSIVKKNADTLSKQTGGRLFLSAFTPLPPGVKLIF